MFYIHNDSLNRFELIIYFHFDLNVLIDDCFI